MWHHQDEEEQPRVEVFSGFPNDNNSKVELLLESIPNILKISWTVKLKLFKHYEEIGLSVYASNFNDLKESNLCLSSLLYLR